MIKLKLNKKRVFEVAICAIIGLGITIAGMCINEGGKASQRKISPETKIIALSKNEKVMTTTFETKGYSGPVSISLQNRKIIGIKKGTYRISYKKNGEANFKKAINSVKFSKYREVKVLKLIPKAEANCTYTILIEKINPDKADTLIHMNYLNVEA